MQQKFEKIRDLLVREKWDEKYIALSYATEV